VCNILSVPFLFRSVFPWTTEAATTLKVFDPLENYDGPDINSQRRVALHHLSASAPEKSSALASVFFLWDVYTPLFAHI
jgi:hypothetical protein